MVWRRVEDETHYDVYQCSSCYAKIMIEEGEELPCYCKNCESEADT